ncbi:GNAT family N-acetyltransferase [Blastochloris sulfoviridis]|uniref:GNAT family N-acetyltransferase n=1 Tax=Blastochloris sulfoviridis TaxID=50712 RepID=A0A5M6I2S5_9HYPH|nr:GNAT family protein [Blastochloris sulfoviridis]KAA5602510.1 GNAT family N-acetyltransferase [Blastochloris sulfoviridis]
MGLFGPVPWSEPSVPAIGAAGVVLRTPQMADYEAWAELRAMSRDFLRPWEPTWPADDLTRSAFRRRLRRYARDQREDLAYPFLVFRADDDVLVGGLTLSNVRRGVAQSASLGYWMGLPYAGRGHMSAAVGALVPFAFRTLRLHRIEAACVPTNQPSIRLLERNQFEREGYARRYLCINGEWADHYLYARVREE